MQRFSGVESVPLSAGWPCSLFALLEGNNSWPINGPEVSLVSPKEGVWGRRKRWRGGQESVPVSSTQNPSSPPRTSVSGGRGRALGGHKELPALTSPGGVAGLAQHGIWARGSPQTLTLGLNLCDQKDDLVSW